MVLVVITLAIVIIIVFSHRSDYQCCMGLSRTEY